MTASNYPPCFKCDDYQCIGEGDAICIKNEAPMLVQEDWSFVYPERPCKKLMKWIRKVNDNAND